MSAPHAAQIINGYLARLKVELSHTTAPASRQEEILTDVTNHIAEARTEMTDETDADVLNLIDRLGDPVDVVAGETAAPQPEASAAPATTRRGPLEIIALLLLFFFWMFGAVLVWLSNAWTLREKAIGTALIPLSIIGWGILAHFLWGFSFSHLIAFIITPVFLAFPAAIYLSVVLWRRTSAVAA